MEISDALPSDDISKNPLSFNSYFPFSTALLKSSIVLMELGGVRTNDGTGLSMVYPGR
jgi:hypothetical protein